MKDRSCSQTWKGWVRLPEMARYDHAWGRDFAARIESEGEKVLTEVISPIGSHSLDAVKKGVQDALAGRRPAW
jgi:hypothetical protein